MNHAFSFLSCIWQDFDDSKMDIISSLPLEMAILILRMLDPRALVSAILVSRHWLRLIRSDAILRRRVYDELKRERLAYKKWVEGRCGRGDKLSIEFLKQLLHRRKPPVLLKAVPQPFEKLNEFKAPAQLNNRIEKKLKLPGPPLATSTPKALPSKVGKIRPVRRDVQRPTPVQRPVPVRKMRLRL